MKNVNSGAALLRRAGQATLISLLVVMLIIGVLAGVLYPQIAGRNEYSASGDVKGAATPLDRADDTSCTVYMEQVTDAAVMYRQDHDAPPPDLQSLKPYGVTNEIINTPNCNFGLPKVAGQPVQGPANGPANLRQPSNSTYSQQPYGAQAGQPSTQPPASGQTPTPGYTVVGGVKVPTSAGDGGADMGGQ